MSVPTLRRSLLLGGTLGLLAAVITAWPLARVAARLIDSGIADQTALRLLHQTALWFVGCGVALVLLKVGLVERYGALLSASSPVLFDATIALAFGMTPLVLHTSWDRAVGALAFTACWVVTSRYSKKVVQPRR